MSEEDLTELILEYYEARNELAVANGVAPTKYKEPADMTWAEESAARYFAMTWRDRGRKF